MQPYVRGGTLFVFITGAILFHTSPLRSADVVSTLVNTGNWGVNANWSNAPALGGFPNNGNAGVATYDAVIGGSLTARLDQNISIQRLILNGATISNNFNLTANDQVTWIGGTVEGVGTLLANGGVLFGGPAQKIISSGRILQNAGSSLWTNGQIRLFTGSTINNSGTFNASSAATLEFNQGFGGTNIFNNIGTYLKSGSGVNRSSVNFHNNGVVTVDQGRFVLDAAGTHSGRFEGAGALEFAFGTHTLSAVSTVTVATVEFTAGNVTNSGHYDVNNTGIRGGTIVFVGSNTNRVQTLEFSSGLLAGPGHVEISGLFTWTGGTMEGMAPTYANGGIVFGGATQKILSNGRTLNNAASALWTNGLIRFFGGGTLNNTGNFTADSAAALDVNSAFGGVAVFNNDGSYLKAGAGANDIGVIFNNDGSVEVQSGQLQLSGGGNSSGRFFGPGTLRFGGGTHVLSGMSTVTVAHVLFSFGTVTNEGRYDVSGSTTGSGGVARFTPASSVGSVGLLTISGATLDFRSGEPIDTATLNLSGGTLAGSDTVTISGLTHWTGGTMQGTGITHANGGMLLGGATQKILEDGRTINNPASALWTNGLLRFFSGGTFNNSGTFTASTAGNLDANAAFAGIATFNNTGSYIKAGIGTNDQAITFNNTGLVDVQAGRLVLSAGGNSLGRFVGSGALEFNGGTHVLSGASTVTVAHVTFRLGTVTNEGRYDVSGGTTASGGTARFTPASSVGSVGPLTISDGTLDFRSGDPINSASLNLSGGFLAGTDTVTINGLTYWTGGTMHGTGTTHANGGMLLGGIFQKILQDGRVVNNPGSALWTNGLIRFFGGATFNNSGTFTANSPAILDISPGFGGVNVFNNTGSYIKAGTGTNEISVTFNNTASVDVQAGALELRAGGASGGRFFGPGTLDFRGGTHLLSGVSTVVVAQVVFSGATVTNEGRYDVIGGTKVSAGAARFTPASSVGSVGPLTISGGTLDLRSGEPIETASLNFSGGILQGTDTVTITGLTLWTGGTMHQTGITHANGGLLLGGTDQKILEDGRTVNNPGSATWTNGLIRFFSGGTFNNQGSFLAESAGILEMNQAFAGSANFNNSGVYVKRGAGTNAISIPFNNSGTFLVEAGQVQFEFGGNYRQTAGATVLTGGVVRAIAPMDIQGGTLTGSGLIIGTVTNNGTLAPGFGAGSLQMGTLICRSNSVMRIEIGGQAQSTGYDFINLTNSAVLGGILEVKFINGFQTTVSSNTVFTIVAAGNSLSGAFANVANGERLYTTDGFGSFRATYNAATKTVVLSEFEPILPVVADFGANKTNGPVPLNVTFVNLTAGSATNFTWTFGDGTSSSVANPSHVYTNVGSYTVSLAASGPGGSNFISKINFITVSDAVCSLMVVNTNDAGDGSLRSAIECANSLVGVDTITFAIPGPGPHTITPLTLLPEITDAVVIDGYSQPGTSPNTLTNGNNAVLRIELNGSNVINGLRISGGGSSIRGLVLNRFIPGSGAILVSGSGNSIQGNFIGTDVLGIGARPNGGNGITVQGSGNTIGGTTASNRNVIAFNSGAGVQVEPAAGGGAATNNAVLGNLIFNNGGLGIDLAASGISGVTPNDSIDFDSGPNHLQNFPLLTRVTNVSGNTIFEGTLHSSPLRTFRLEFFSNPACETNGYGEGQTLLGATEVTTDPAGNTPFMAVFPTAGGSVFAATATDPDNNTSEFSACVEPTTGCDLTCPTNIVVVNTPNQCGATVFYPAPQAVGDCGAVNSTPPSGSFFPVGTTMVSCTTTSGASCSFNITVLDEQAPSITCPLNVVLSTDPGVCSRSNVIYTVTFSDNCAGANLVQTAGLPSGATFPKGTTTNSFVVTDASGNTANCSFVVTVIDTEAPMLTCPANIVRATDPGQCSASNVTFAAVLADNCPGAIVQYAPPPGSTFAKGLTTVLCFATDAAGNTNSCSFTVTINDQESPTLTCPADVVLSTDPGVCSRSNLTYAAIVSDNCPGATVQYTPASGSTFAKGITTVTCLATDAAGNTNSCTFTVTIQDQEPPGITCPANIVLSTDAGQCSVSNVTYAAVLTDNCPGATVQYTPPSGSTFPKGVTIVTCLATDSAGNTNSCTFTVTIQDQEPPPAICPADIVRSTDAGQCTASNLTYAAIVNDNCPGVNVTYDPPAGSTFAKGTNTVTRVATDTAGNTTQCTFKVIVNDTQPPAIICPNPIVVTAAQDATNAVVNFSPTATDNCPGVSISSTPSSGSLFPLGTTTVNCVATDGAGNTNSCAFTVTVTSPEAPRADVSLTKLASPGSATVGSQISYSLLVSNAGPEIASTVTLIDSLPSVVTFVSAQSDFGNCTQMGNNVVCELGTLAEGDAATVTITVIADAAGTVCNFASVQSQEIDLVLSNNTASVCTLVTSPLAGADLSVTKIDALDPVTVGSDLTYNIRVRNNGPQAATGVILTDILPPGMTVVSLPTNSTVAGDTVTCMIGSLNAGASVTKTIVLTASGVGQVCNTASVTASQTDPVTANNIDVACTEITEVSQPVHDLAVVKITAPPNITLTAKGFSRTRFVTVQIQNRSPHNEVISSLSGFGTNLVTLQVESLGICPDLVARLHVGPPQRALPVTLKPKQKMNVVFDVTFTTNCISDPGKTTKTTPGHEDYRYFARVHHQALDGHADTHPENDYGPRSVNPPFEIDPNPDGTIKDTGVGKLKPNKTFGADITTDVVFK